MIKQIAFHSEIKLAATWSCQLDFIRLEQPKSEFPKIGDPNIVS